MKVTVDESTCTGCEVCTDLAPDVFEIDDDMISRVKVDAVPSGSEDKVREAVDSCPVACIDITEE